MICISWWTACGAVGGFHYSIFSLFLLPLVGNHGLDAEAIEAALKDIESLNDKHHSYAPLFNPIRFQTETISCQLNYPDFLEKLQW